MSELPIPKVRIVTLTAKGHKVLEKRRLRDFLPAETVRVLAANGYGPVSFEAVTREPANGR